MKKIVLVMLFFLTTSLFAFEELTNENFDEKIAGKNVIVDFHAIWWGSCKVLEKNMTKYATSTKPKDIYIYKVDVSKQKELTKRFKAFGVPTLVYLEDGMEVGRQSGVLSVEELEETVKEYFE